MISTIQCSCLHTKSAHEKEEGKCKGVSIHHFEPPCVCQKFTGVFIDDTYLPRWNV